MATEYFDGYHWKNGKSSNIDSTGVDRSVWLENEKQAYKISNYNVNLYLLGDLQNKDIFKIGIASNIYNRCKQINKDCKYLRLNHNFKIIDCLFIGERDIAERFEKVILEKYNKNKIYKRSLFSGATEVVRTRKDQILEDFNIIKNYRNNVNIS